MGRTLYLSETDKFRAVADGPSIWIDWEHRAGHRIPLRLISRCIIVGNIQLDSALISVLAANNIPIIFTNASGHELAIALPYNHKLPQHWREQRVFLETKKNRERYVAWARIKRMTIQLNLIRKLFPNRAKKYHRDIDEDDYRQMISFFKPKEEAKWDTIKGFIENLFRGVLIESLIKSELNLNLGIIHRYHNFGLVLDFGYILEALIDEQCIQFFRLKKDYKLLEKKEKTWHLTRDGLKEIIHRFENKKDDITNIIENTLEEFFQLMRELRI